MPLMRRRPLLRAAAVGGGAYAMGKRNARLEQERQDQAYDSGVQTGASVAPARTLIEPPFVMEPPNVPAETVLAPVSVL